MKKLDAKLIPKPPHSVVKLPVLQKTKQHQRRCAGPSLYNFYQKIIDRTAGIDTE